MRVLVLGGYGQFGRRIVGALARDAGLELIVAGRDEAKAQALVDALTDARATLSAAVLDIERNFAEALAHLRPDVVVHTAGPFQQRGYGVASATLAAGAHYIDLADGRAFVEGFRAVATASAVAASSASPRVIVARSAR